MPYKTKSERNTEEFTKEELDQIKRLLDKATAELERGDLSQAHEALLAARQTYERLGGKIAKESGAHGGGQMDFVLELAQSDKAIARSERRLAAHVRNTFNDE